MVLCSSLEQMQHCAAHLGAAHGPTLLTLPGLRIGIQPCRNSTAGAEVAKVGPWGGSKEGTLGQGSVGAQGMEGFAPGLWI